MPEEAAMQAGCIPCLVAVSSNAGQELLRDTGLMTEETERKPEEQIVKPFAVSSIRQQIMEQLDKVEFSELLTLK